jgi:cleavage and polyadenylation specificity factor subunit 2
MITFTPLSSSARSPSSSAGELPPLAYLLQLDDIKILIDCGSPDLLAALEEERPTDGEYERLLRECVQGVLAIRLPLPNVQADLTCSPRLSGRHAPTVNLVLLTHSSLPHLGYLPFARAQLGLTCPVYATVPIASMGRVACLEEAETWRAELDGSAWEVEDVAAELASKDDGAEMTGLVEPDLADRAEAQAVKTRRVKWVATADEVGEAFDAISRVKYESPTRLMGKSLRLHCTSLCEPHTYPFAGPVRSGPVKLTRCAAAAAARHHRGPLVIDHHCLLGGPHARRHDLEDPLALSRHDPSRRRPQSHARAPS